MHWLSLRSGVFLQAPTQIWAGWSNVFMQINIGHISFFSTSEVFSQASTQIQPWPHNALWPATLHWGFLLSSQQLVITGERLRLDWTSIQELEGQKGCCKTAMQMLIKPKVRGKLGCLLWGNLNCRQAPIPHINSVEKGSPTRALIKGFGDWCDFNSWKACIFSTLQRRSQWGPER